MGASALDDGSMLKSRQGSTYPNTDDVEAENMGVNSDEVRHLTGC